MTAFAAVDLGASSGRVMVGVVAEGRLDLHELHRFWNGPVAVSDGLHWDVLGIWREVLHGLWLAGRSHELTSVGVDSWAVDYGLLDSTGALLGNPYHYRDRRTDGVAEGVHSRLSFVDMYAENGLQYLPFTTVYQLAAARGTPQLAAARKLLLIPDLLNHWLSGHIGSERTNASTTGLLDVATGEWSSRLSDLVDLNPGLLPPLHDPGSVLGPLRPGLGLSGLLVAVGSHDTASAIVGVPADGERFAYICCGTWGLVGVELERPVLSDQSRTANFTNEWGVDGTVRYLRNVMGLWLLQESLRGWGSSGESPDLDRLLTEAAALSPGPVIDVDDPVFLPTGPMADRIVDACRRRGLPEPQTRAEVVRCILDSLADAFARTVRDAVRLSGRDVDVVHLVGGGALNRLLCQLTADACGLPVLAGPVEATALGNVLIQARVAGVVGPELADLRRLGRESHAPQRYLPMGATL